jgi:hypothetical protein
VSLAAEYGAAVRTVVGKEDTVAQTTIPDADSPLEVAMPTVDLLAAEETVENMETNIGKRTTLMGRLVFNDQGGGEFLQWENVKNMPMSSISFLASPVCFDLSCPVCYALLLADYL